MLERLLAPQRAGPFHYLTDLEPARLVTVLEHEHPQARALILSHLGAAQAAAVLALLPERLQPEVSLRLAHMDVVAPSVVAHIDALLRTKLATVVGQDAPQTGGGATSWYACSSRSPAASNTPSWRTSPSATPTW